jgi:hypothetical protein
MIFFQHARDVAAAGGIDADRLAPVDARLHEKAVHLGDPAVVAGPEVGAGEGVFGAGIPARPEDRVSPGSVFNGGFVECYHKIIASDFYIFLRRRPAGPLKKTFYITTPIYYPSDKLHIGHSYTAPWPATRWRATSACRATTCCF